MITNIMQFDFNGLTVRTLADEQGEPWFVAKDVAEVLGYKLPDKAIRDHCKASQKMTPPKRTGQRGGAQFQTVIPERDVYRLIMRSKLPRAEAFEEWVVGEVLPSIRKHGGYVQGQENEDDPQMLMARALKVAESVMAEKDKQLEEQREMLEENLTVDSYRAFYLEDYMSHGEKVKLGQRASKLSRQQGVPVEAQVRVVQTRYGDIKETTVNLYNKQVLDQAAEEIGLLI